MGLSDRIVETPLNTQQLGVESVRGGEVRIYSDRLAEFPVSCGPLPGLESRQSHGEVRIRETWIERKSARGCGFAGANVLRRHAHRSEYELRDFGVRQRVLRVVRDCLSVVSERRLTRSRSRPPRELVMAL